MLSPFLRRFPLLLLGMKFLLGLLFHKVLGLVLPLGLCIFLTHRLLSHYIIHLRRILRLSDPKGTLFAYCSSLRGSLHDPSSFLAYVEYQSGMRRVPPSTWLSLVMGDHASSKSLLWHVPCILLMGSIL